MLSEQRGILTCIDSYIEPLLWPVLATDKLGMSYGTIAVDCVSSSCGRAKGDHFKLSIPYAKYNVTWNVLFDSKCPEMGPDFIFNDTNFLLDMDIRTLSAKVPSLAKWDPNNTNALLNVLIELLTCYKQHQVQLLDKQNRLQVEYAMLMKSDIVKPEDVETILLPSSTKPTDARFLISLPIDVSRIQVLISESENNIAMLLVTFSGTDWARITPQLHFSKSLEETLNKAGTLFLPPFPPDKCLIDYVPQIKKYIESMVNAVAESLEKRREYTAAAVGLHGNALLEYDTTQFTYIVQLRGIDDFHFTQYTQLPLNFPKERPVVSLQSIYHRTSQSEVCQFFLKKYDFNPSWTPYQIYENICSAVKSQVSQFKKYCSKRSTYKDCA